MAVPSDYAWPKAEAEILKSEWNRDAQSRRNLQHLVEKLCAVDDIGFDSESAEITAFNAGRRWVARQIQRAVLMPLDQLAPQETPINEPRNASQRADIHASTRTRISRVKSGYAG